MLGFLSFLFGCLLFGIGCLLIKLVLRRGSGVANDGGSFLIKRVQSSRDAVNQELGIGVLLFI
jgi:hypothetical protein